MERGDANGIYKIFKYATDSCGTMPLKNFFEMLADQGIHICSDPRFGKAMEAMKAALGPFNGETLLDYPTMLSILKTSDVLVRAVQQNLVIPNFQEFIKSLELVYRANLSDEHEEVNDPCSQKPKEDTWAVAMMSTDGQKAVLGQTNAVFPLNSVSRPFLYGLVLQELGLDEVANYCGLETVPLGFTETELNDKGLPHNPMTMAGAIVMCALWQSLIAPRRSQADKFEKFLCHLKEFTGGQVLHCSNVAVIVEKESSHMIRGIIHNLKHKENLPPGTNIEALLDFYFQVRSLQVNSSQLAQMGAVFANDGLHPITQKSILSPQLNRYVLTAMKDCGVYSIEDDFTFNVGMPAVFSSAGSCLLLAPGFYSIAMHSPFLNDFGHKLIVWVSGPQTFSKLYSFHPFDTPQKLHPEVSAQCTIHCDFFLAAAEGDIESFTRVAAMGGSVGHLNYMQRTVLHEAATTGQLEICKIIMNLCPDLIDVQDNLGKTALDDATALDQKEIAEFLTNWTAVRRVHDPTPAERLGSRRRKSAAAI